MGSDCLDLGHSGIASCTDHVLDHVLGLLLHKAILEYSVYCIVRGAPYCDTQDAVH